MNCTSDQSSAFYAGLTTSQRRWRAAEITAQLQSRRGDHFKKETNLQSRGLFHTRMESNESNLDEERERTQQIYISKKE